MSDILLTRAVDPTEWDRPEWLTRRECDQCAGPRRREKVAARAAAKSLLLKCFGVDAETAVPADLEWVAGDRGRPLPQFDDQLAETLDDEARHVSISWSHTADLVTVIVARLSRL